jgi:hypothetical protein
MTLIYVGVTMLLLLGAALAYQAATRLAERDVRDAWTRARERQREESPEEVADRLNW